MMHFKQCTKELTSASKRKLHFYKFHASEDLFWIHLNLKHSHLNVVKLWLLK